MQADAQSVGGWTWEGAEGAGGYGALERAWEVAGGRLGWGDGARGCRQGGRVRRIVGVGGRAVGGSMHPPAAVPETMAPPPHPAALPTDLVCECVRVLRTQRGHPDQCMLLAGPAGEGRAGQGASARHGAAGQAACPAACMPRPTAATGRSPAHDCTPSRRRPPPPAAVPSLPACRRAPPHAARRAHLVQHVCAPHDHLVARVLARRKLEIDKHKLLRGERGRGGPGRAPSGGQPATRRPRAKRSAPAARPADGARGPPAFEGRQHVRLVGADWSPALCHPPAAWCSS